VPGVVLLRKPLPNAMGHVAISDGQGGTIEAAGVALGVRQLKVEERHWDAFCYVPGLIYDPVGTLPSTTPLPTVITLKRPPTTGPKVRTIQNALKARGFSPGQIDGKYGPHTVAAVVAFQSANKLIADGVVGPLTAQKLGVTWP
jgi:N-acetylmuramoyl-L-alanine amidase